MRIWNILTFEKHTHTKERKRSSNTKTHHKLHSKVMVTVGSWFEGSFTVDVSEPKPNRPNIMNLVEKRAQELGLCEDFVNGRAGLLGSEIIKGIEEG